MDIGFLMTILWALGAITVWGSVFRDALGSWHRYHDRRAKREAIWAFTLFLVGVCSCFAIAAFVIAPEGRGIRAALSAIALGAFLGAGIVVKTLSGPDNEPRP